MADYNLIARKYLASKTDGHCGYCGVKLTTTKWRPTDITTSYTIDHKIPSSKGGDDSEENLIACCRSCNSRKSTKSLEEFRIYIKHKIAERHDEYLGAFTHLIPPHQLKEIQDLSVKLDLLILSTEFQFYFEGREKDAQ